MDNQLNAIQIVLFCLMVFGIAFAVGKKMHTDIFPKDTPRLNLSNKIFSFLTTAWILFAVLHFSELLSMIPLRRAGIPLGIIILVSPYLILRAALKSIESKML